ncbi:MAG: substrate-binding domain-containing protein [Deferribacterota bacterium]|nr:substrate-binding domain-containing protein [Deferribacterota bacterium]
MRFLYLVLIVLFCAVNIYGAENDLLMATTTSADNTGLLEYLSDKAKKDIGIELKWVATGSGKALKHGMNCDVDVLLVHSEKKEIEFMNKGYGKRREQFMYNYFVLVGPKSEKNFFKKKNILNTLKYIKENGLKFISRGDESGTHIKEKELWNKCCGSVPENKKWYIENGLGMIETLLMANEMKAYTLSDMATYLTFKKRVKRNNITILVGKSRELKNPYSIILVNPENCENVKYKLANKFIDWLISKKTLDYISQYTIDGKQLFYILK